MEDFNVRVGYVIRSYIVDHLYALKQYCMGVQANTKNKAKMNKKVGNYSLQQVGCPYKFKTELLMQLPNQIFISYNFMVHIKGFNEIKFEIKS